MPNIRISQLYTNESTWIIYREGNPNFIPQWLLSSGIWTSDPHETFQFGLFKSYSEAQSVLNAWLQTLPPEQFAEYIAERICS